MYQYAYLVGNFMVFLLWLLLFLKRKDLRKEMLFMGLFAGFLGPVWEFWYKDYWRPEYAFKFLPMFEDCLFGFLIGGISAVIYEEIFAKKLIKRKKKAPYCLIILLAIVSISAFLLFNHFLGINSIYVSFIVFLIVSFVIWRRRPDLVYNSFLSGFFLTIAGLIGHLFFLSLYPNIIKEWWLLHNISGILILGIPIEEPIWFFLWGMVGGPLYEFWQGYRLKDRKK